MHGAEGAGAQLPIQLLDLGDAAGAAVDEVGRDAGLPQQVLPPGFRVQGLGFRVEGLRFRV